MVEPLQIIAEGLHAPEGPVALADGSILVCEMAAGRLSQIAPGGALSVVAETGGTPNGAAIGADGKVYICNRGQTFWREVDGKRQPAPAPDLHGGGSIQRIDLETGAVETLYTACDGVELNGPNDLVIDAQGGIYFTDHGHARQRTRDRSGVFYAAPDGSEIREIIPPLEMPNGIGLSADERWLFVAETLTQHLYRFEIERPGVIKRSPHPFPQNGGYFVANPGGMGHYDSLAIDSAGHVAVASVFAQCFYDIDPADGSFTRIPVPDIAPTNICFGGPDLQTAYMTLAASGRLVTMRWPRPGLPLIHQRTSTERRKEIMT